MNAPTLIVAVILVAVCATIVYKLVQDRKNGKGCSNCSGCSGCAMKDSCHS